MPQLLPVIGVRRASGLICIDLLYIKVIGLILIIAGSATVLSRAMTTSYRKIMEIIRIMAGGDSQLMD